MFGRVIWDKSSKCIFENFEIAQVKQAKINIFKKHWYHLSPKSPKSNMWLLVNHTKPTNTLY